MPDAVHRVGVVFLLLRAHFLRVVDNKNALYHGAE